VTPVVFGLFTRASLWIHMGWLGKGSSLVHRSVIPLCDAVDRPRGVVAVLTCDNDDPSTVHRPYYFSYQKLLDLSDIKEVA
jgi:hypothetical protein